MVSIQIVALYIYTDITVYDSIYTHSLCMCDGAY